MRICAYGWTALIIEMFIFITVLLDKRLSFGGNEMNLPVSSEYHSCNITVQNVLDMCWQLYFAII